MSVINVTDTKGDIVTPHAPTSIAGRTDTGSGTKERVAQVVGNKTARTYETAQTNYDIALRYSDVDAWRRFSDYDSRILSMIYHRMGLDQLLIGWYGKACAKDTDRETNPLLQDVNFGWMYDLYTNKPENWIKADSGQKLKLGAGGDWNNLDQLAYELLSLIPEENRTGNEMVLVGRRIVAWESGKIFEAHGQTPSEKTKFSLLSKTYGGLPATSPACFPDTGVMVTDPANLQIYIQEGASGGSWSTIRNATRSSTIRARTSVTGSAISTRPRRSTTRISSSFPIRPEPEPEPMTRNRARNHKPSFLAGMSIAKQAQCRRAAVEPRRGASAIQGPRKVLA
ncbi:MAG: phage major capsid protein, P2 family [Lentisphaeria bacterium]|nr:MAG: phage major capsid protein, P2 family [Lentisphaeria bacterium]